MNEPRRRSGAETRAEAQRVALALFISQGYEATSLRQIAERLGISKASLYYHFASKEDIVRSGFAERGDEAAELLAWVRAQPPAPDLLERTVLRWVDSQSVEKLRGIRFANANPLLLRSLAARGGGEIGDNLQAVAALIAGDDADPARLLLTRMALLSINAAVSAAEGTELTDEQIVAAARRHALAVLARMPDRTAPNTPENG